MYPWLRSCAKSEEISVKHRLKSTSAMKSTSMTSPLSKGAQNDTMVSTLTVTAIAVADMIGIGVFTSLGFQIQDIPSVFALIMLWIVGGIVALCGALSYAELAAAFPRSGGEYNFLSRSFHPAVGFLAGWVSATVGFSAPVALAAMAFGSYFHGVVPSAPPLPLAFGVIGFVSLAHLSGVRQGSAFHNISTFLKVGLIAALVIAALTSGVREPVSFAPALQDFSYMTSAPFAISLVFVLYSYSGWNAGTYISSEVRNPQQTLPVAIFCAISIVIALYVGVNGAFLYTTPLQKMSGQLDVGLIAGRHIFGAAGGDAVGLLICACLVSSISAMTWIGPRVTMVMGEDLPALSFFSRKTKTGVPAAAILTQLAIESLLLLTQTFENALDLIQFSLTLCSFLTVLGLIILRYRQPDLPRPYRAWGYPVTPLIFLSVTMFVLYHLIAERPMQSFIGLLTILSGLILYYAGRNRSQIAEITVSTEKLVSIDHYIGVNQQCTK
jgi:basic amino acid/polyamine antiporter, APA family